MDAESFFRGKGWAPGLWGLGSAEHTLREKLLGLAGPGCRLLKRRADRVSELGSLTVSPPFRLNAVLDLLGSAAAGILSQNSFVSRIPVLNLKHDVVGPENAPVVSLMWYSSSKGFREDCTIPYLSFGSLIIQGDSRLTLDSSLRQGWILSDSPSLSLECSFPDPRYSIQLCMLSTRFLLGFETYLDQLEIRIWSCSVVLLSTLGF